jgi:hypothetical protein
MKVGRVEEWLAAKKSMTLQVTCRVTKIRIATARIISDCEMFLAFPFVF